jgi:RNA polymerase sigma-70 factor (ECF subfamily)
MDTPPDTELEIDLLRRTGAGDLRSFEQLYERFAGVLFSVTMQVLGNREASEDVLQDVFIAIWEKAPLYDATRGKPLTWAVTLTRNKAIDHLRSLQRRGRLKDRAEQEAKVLEHARDGASLDEVDAAEHVRIVRGAVSQLAREQREAIELAFFSGLTQVEIAEKLQEPLGTIKARIRRGMIKLKEVIVPAL